MKNFVLIGAGYVAPRHAQAIKEVGGNLVAFTDPHDSVGWMDSYFPEAKYFREFERFDRFVDKFNRKDKIDYVSIASPNYLHDSQVRWGLKNNADIICEKPLVCHSRNLDALKELESETGRKVWTILQLRLHLKAVEARLRYSNTNRSHKVTVRYSTPRGRWYNHSWKGDASKSGGLATNIGIHLFDLVTWLFGYCKDMSVTLCTDEMVMGWLELENASVNWRLSVDTNEPASRLFKIDGENIELSNGFAELHTKSYKHILDGSGFGISEVQESIKICEGIRNFGREQNPSAGVHWRECEDRPWLQDSGVCVYS